MFIRILGDTALGFTEDVLKRFESYGWHTQVVSDGDADFAGLQAAIEEAKAVTGKPSLIKIRYLLYPIPIYLIIELLLGLDQKIKERKKCMVLLLARTTLFKSKPNLDLIQRNFSTFLLK